MSIRLADSRVSIRRFVWLGPLTLASSIVAVMIVRAVAVALLHPASSFAPLQALPPILDTAGLVTWAVLIFGAMSRFLSNAIQKFKTVSLVVLVLSFLPDIALADRRWFGGTWAHAVALMAMHIAAWAVCVTMLTRCGTADPPSRPRQIRVKHVVYFVFLAILAGLVASPMAWNGKIPLIALLIICAMYGVLLHRLRTRRVGPAAVGSFYDMLERDKRKAMEIIVDRRAEQQAPEDAEGDGPEKR